MGLNQDHRLITSIYVSMLYNFFLCSARLKCLRIKWNIHIIKPVKCKLILSLVKIIFLKIVNEVMCNSL